MTGDNNVLDCNTPLNRQGSWKTICQFVMLLSWPWGEQKRLLLHDWPLHVNLRRKLFIIGNIFSWKESARQVDLPSRANVTGVVIEISTSAVRAEGVEHRKHSNTSVNNVQNVPNCHKKVFYEQPTTLPSSPFQGRKTNRFCLVPDGNVRSHVALSVVWSPSAVLAGS